jgi:hypothetical protein
MHSWVMSVQFIYAELLSRTVETMGMQKFFSFK